MKRYLMKSFTIFLTMVIVLMGGLTLRAKSTLEANENSNIKSGLNKEKKWTGRLVVKNISEHKGLGDPLIIITEINLTFIESSSQHHGETSFTGEAIVKIDKPKYKTTEYLKHPLTTTIVFNPTEVKCHIDGEIDRIKKNINIWFREGKKVDYESTTIVDGYVFSHEKHKLSAFDLVMGGNSTVCNEGDISFSCKKEHFPMSSSDESFEIKDNCMILSSKYEIDMPATYYDGIERKYTIYSISEITGELYRIYTKKDTIGKTIKINETIKTDKFTQREIVVPDVGEVIINTNSEVKFSENNMFEQTIGELFSKVDKLKEEGVKFDVETPQAVSSARGTQFITNVEDSTTTLIVLDGEVEFSDINMKKTVIVKKNQKSMCKTNGLPTEPETIDIDQILKWWE